jgi:hypothetical protein
MGALELAALSWRWEMTDFMMLQVGGVPWRVLVDVWNAIIVWEVNRNE